MNHGRSQLDESRIRTEVFRRDCIRASYDRLEEYYGVAEEGQFKKTRRAPSVICNVTALPPVWGSDSMANAIAELVSECR